MDALKNTMQACSIHEAKLPKDKCLKKKKKKLPEPKDDVAQISFCKRSIAQIDKGERRLLRDCFSDGELISALNKLQMEVIENNADTKEIRVRVHNGSQNEQNSVDISFTPHKCFVHGLFRQDKMVPYYASDLIKFAFFKAKELALFQFCLPDEIVFKSIKHKATIELLNTVQPRSSEAIEAFLRNSALGKVFDRCLTDFDRQLVYINYPLPFRHGDSIVVKTNAFSRIKS